MSGWGSGPWGSMPWGGGDVVVVPPVTEPLVAYRIVLAERSASGLGTPIISDVLAAGVPIDADAAGRWSRTLNAAGTLEFSLPIDGCTPEDFDPGKRELHLYRDDGSGERLVWAGHLWTADVAAPWVRFLGMGFYEALRHREISDDFYRHAAEQRGIAWDLIDYTQGQTDGGLGIVRASAAGSAITRTVTYCAEERQVIADAIEDLAAADDGFDFDIGPDKVWRTWSPLRGTDRTADVVLDTRNTIVDLSYTVDATQVENDVAGIGAKGDCEPIHFVRAVDTESRAAYGLMQGAIQRSDIKQDDDLIDSLAAERLSLLKGARKQPVVKCFQGLVNKSPLDGDFDNGDVIGVRASWGYASFGEAFRLMSYAVSFDRLGHEFIELTLDSHSGTIAADSVTAKAISVTTTATPALATSAGHVTAKTIAASMTATAAIARKTPTLKTIAATATITAAIARSTHALVTQAVAAASAVTAALATVLRHPSSTPKTVAASATVAPTLDASFNAAPGTFRAFSAASYWNTPLPSSGVLHPSSAAYVAWLKANMTNGYLSLGDGAFSMPIYWSTSADPLVTINPTNGPTTTFRLPAAAAPMTGNDQAMLIIDRTTNQDVQLFEFSRSPLGATGIARYYLNSNGLAGDVAGSSQPTNEGHRGIPGTVHAVRFDEVADGAIRHRTKFALGQPGNDPGQPFWPMDGFESPRSGIIPEGVVMRIKASYTFPTSLTPNARVIAQHLKTYGSIVGDTAGAGKAALKLENTDWTSLGITRTSLKAIPWDAYEFVAAEWGKP